jgi:hypothetical protein
MSSPLAMMLGYHTRQADGFDPLVDLSGLLYLTHTDDSTVSAGRVSAINDRLASYTFSQGTAANRFFADTTEKPGHTVWSQATTARYFVSRSDATLAGQFDGAPAATVGVYAKIANTGVTAEMMGHTNDTTSYTSSAMRFALAQANERWRLQEALTGVGSSFYIYDLPGSVPTSWALLTAVSDGAGSVSFYQDGVLIGSDTATHRVPAALAHVVLGNAGTTSGTPSYFIGGHFACLGQLNTVSMAALSTWFAGSFA